MYRWDGGFIMVDVEHFDQAVQWYEELLGWKCLDKVTSWVGRKQLIQLIKFTFPAIDFWTKKNE